MKNFGQTLLKKIPLRTLFSKFLTPGLNSELSNLLDDWLDCLFQPIPRVGWLVVSNQSSSGLFNSDINPGIKNLANKCLNVSVLQCQLLNFKISLSKYLLLSPTHSEKATETKHFKKFLSVRMLPLKYIMQLFHRIPSYSMK